MSQMKSPCKSAAEALAESPVAGILELARLLDQLSAAVEAGSRELMPGNPSPPALRCALQGDIVIVSVGTPALAAKLRQRTASLLQQLRETWPQITGIRVRLQPGSINYPMPGVAAAGAAQPVDRPTVAGSDREAARRFADELADKLRDSPLRDAARRLQAALRDQQGTPE